MGNFRRAIGTLLTAFGLTLLLGIGAVYAYGAYQRNLVYQELKAQSRPDMVVVDENDPTATIPPTHTPTPTPRPATPEIMVRSTPPPQPTASPTSTPSPTPTPLPITRIVAPTIDLDSLVAEATIVDGEWEVPKFVAGHLAKTARPGAGSNIVLSGHVHSISSGDVFANLDRLQVGDSITLLTWNAEFRYVVEEIRVVSNTDLSVVQPTTSEVLTLITCTGLWNPLQIDYEQRLVIIARPE